MREMKRFSHLASALNLRDLSDMFHLIGNGGCSFEILDEPQFSIQPVIANNCEVNRLKSEMHFYESLRFSSLLEVATYQINFERNLYSLFPRLSCAQAKCHDSGSLLAMDQ